MKKRKLLIWLMAVLSLSLLLISCSEANESNGEDVPPISPDSGVSQNAIAHEIRDYFVLEGELETANYSQISRINGEIVDKDTEHNLLAVKTKDLDVKNRVKETIKVYDLNTGDVINVQSVTNDLYADAKKKTELSVDIDYPIIRVVRKSVDEDDKLTYDVSYYLAKNDSKSIHSSDNNAYEMKRFENGLVACKMGDEVLWIDKDMEIVRTVDAVVANGYEIDSFNAEYEGYVYVWNSNSIQIFDRSGICCAAHKLSDSIWMSCYVLNNGNVLIQEREKVDEFTPCDFILRSERYTVTSYIMGYKDGAITPVELDYLVVDLETAYDEEYYLPFELAEGRANGAFILRFANEMLAVSSEYVVMNDAIEIEYSLKNTTPGVYLTSAYALNANYYVAYVEAGGCTRPYIFDLDGNKISAYADGYVNGKFIVTEGAIYDYSMNVLIDLEKSDVKYENIVVDEMTDNVYLSKFNYQTAQEEWYLFDGTAAEPRLFTDGKDSQFMGAGNGICVTVSDDNVYTLFSADGTELLVTYGFPRIDMFDELIVISTEFEGDPVVYVLK